MSPRPNSLTHPRGRLPARVYWVRRSLVAATALALVFGIAHLLGGGGSGGGNDTARLSADQQTSGSSPSVSTVLPSIGVHKTPKSSPSVTLAQPDGPCSADELSVTPVVSQAYALHPVTIKLELSGSSPACTFTVSPKTVAVKVTSGNDRIWSSQDCPKSIKKQTVVVRSGADTTVPVTWRGRRSNGSCSTSNPWALPGYYHVLGAAIGSTPADTQFKMTVAPRAVITKTAHPKPKKKGDEKGDKKSTASSSPSSSSSPSVKGKGSKCGGDNVASSC